MDEVRQADGTDPASSPAWAGGEGRDVGDGRAAGGAPGWAPATEPPESAVEPLALLTTTGANEERPAGGRRYAPGLDDDTPVGGLPMAEPPLWREAAHSAGLGYGALSQYDPAGPTGEFATVPPPEQPAGLPQRVPAEPDVPELPESEPGNRERWTAPELAWIADQLKRDDVPHEPAEGLDVDAVLAAVRDVPGVRSASVRPNPDGIHTLRLDLADDADPGQVSRLVARLLEERMGLSAAPNHPVGQAPWSTPTEPSGTGDQATVAPATGDQATAAPATGDQATVAPATGSPGGSGARAPESGESAFAPAERGEEGPAEPVATGSPAAREANRPRQHAAARPVEEVRPSERARTSERARPVEHAAAGPAEYAAARSAEPAAAGGFAEHRAPYSDLTRAFERSAPAGPPADTPTEGWRPPRPRAETTPAPEPAAGQTTPAERNAPERPPVEEAGAVVSPEVVSRPLIPPQPGLRVVIDQVRVDTVGLDAVVEVELSAGERRARGRAIGAAVDTYLARLAAVAAADAIDQLLKEVTGGEPVPDSAVSRCFVEHTGVVPFGTTEVAVVVLLLACGGWVERLTGAALAEGDPRQAMVRATLGAVNRRLEALLG